MAEIEITIVENVVSSFELLELIMSCVCVFVFLCGCVFPNSEVFGNMIFFFFFCLCQRDSRTSFSGEMGLRGFEDH